MRTIAVIASTIFSLAACGGGSGGDNNTSGSNGQSGSDSSSNTSPPPQACANSPVITSSTRYFGVLPTGQVSEFNFDTAAGTRTHRLDGVQSVSPMTRAADCNYTTAGTEKLQTAFLPNGLAVSAA